MTTRLRYRWLLPAGLVLLIGLVNGCTAGRRDAGRIVYAPSAELDRSHTLFNPHWNPAGVAEVYRSDWPSVVAYDTQGEQIEYQETIIDQQGRSDQNQDLDYYRQFRSIRRGRAAR